MRRNKYSYKEVKEYIEGIGYSIISTEYYNNKASLDVRCSEGHEYTTSFLRVNKGHRCPKCKGTQRLTLEDVQKEIEKCRYRLLSKEYKNSATKLDMECNIGHQYTVTYGNFRKGSRCPTCKFSRGERLVAYILSTVLPKNISVEHQKPVKIANSWRYFDFFFRVGGVDVYVEYDGEFHFKPKKLTGGHKGLEGQRTRDKEKTDFVAETGGLLVRIPFQYTNKQVYKLLRFHLVNHVEGLPELIDFDAMGSYYIEKPHVRDIVAYYMEHDGPSTAAQYGVSSGTVYNYFRNVHGMTKREYLKLSITEQNRTGQGRGQGGLKVSRELTHCKKYRV